MNLPLQQEWAPELLNELQRAVPVLESGSFDFDDEAANADDGILHGRGRRANAGWPNSREDSGLRWGGLAADASASLVLRGALYGDFGADQGAELLAVPTDFLSDDAMALPMSTLTSGKRHTYPSKSTFQAHVCCVMDTLQVVRVLERLRESPQFKSARSWPHAYRIISPFNGEVHEGAEDDEDPGAGQKMLGLLKRMGLENLLLVVSRWDSGPMDRLGIELFKCVNEQCKELLRDLQQAVRASFPMDDLSHRSKLEDGGGTESNAGVLLALPGDDCDEEMDDCLGLVYGAEDDAASSEKSGQEGQECRQIDLRLLGKTPSGPLRRENLAPASRRRAQPPTAQKEEGRHRPGNVEHDGLLIRRVPLTARVSSAASTAQNFVASRQTSSSEEARRLLSQDLTHEEMERLPTEALLELSGRLQSKRQELEEALTKMLEKKGAGRVPKMGTSSTLSRRAVRS